MEIRVFLESEVYGFEDFKAESFDEAMVKIEKLWCDARAAFKEDKILRKIGLIVER